jgi:hypothetical protein
MKNQTRDRKLPLRKEVVRSLTQLELGNVNGGHTMPTTTFTSLEICPPGTAG